MKSDKIIYSVLLFAIVITGVTSFYYALKALQNNPSMEKAVSKESSGLHFVLIPQETDNDYWRLVEKGARKAEKEQHVTLEYNGPKKSSVSSHIEWIEKAIASKVDGIITQGLQDEAFRPVINKAIAKGIPVVTIDTDAPSSNRSAYVGTDNYQAGFLAGKALIKDTGGKANVGIITGSFDTRNMQLRVQGFKDALQQSSNVHILDIRESHITRIQAAEKTEQMIQKHPEIDAFFGTSALDCFGIVSSLQQRGRIDGTYIIAFDTLPETLDLIREGIVDATVEQTPYQMGYESVNLIKSITQGNKVSKIHHTDTSIIRKQNLEPIKVKKEIMP
ncbi:sugar-binding protein [Halobacillus salinarum]|uniref:Sugar-binding protein n=1 Tax=Halobacillus salinarum TaxID=2932257 RepID=A0ABY4EIV9_9BACI|nr:sugar-binding protein [Halobacillus salinarum]UOQ44421.1 sugar-binding protein [Halobacillus salinarum]